MQNIPFQKDHFSPLILGTVQLGMLYGISNRSGQPSRKDGIDMVKYAFDRGINTFDTAREYGTSESVIAEAQKMQQNRMQVITKFRINPAHEERLEKVWVEVLAIVQESLKVLDTPKATGILFHRSPLNNLESVMKILPTIIRRLKEMGLADYGGLSAHYPEDASWAIQEEELQIIQVPCNLFDHRFLNMVPQGRLANKLVIARSIFLQGLFFLEPDALEGPMKVVREPLRRLHEIAEETGLSIAKLAVSFIRDQPQVDCLVIGALNQAQISQNIKWIKQPMIDRTVRDKIREVFSEMDHFIVTPALWPQ